MVDHNAVNSGLLPRQLLRQQGATLLVALNPQADTGFHCGRNTHHPFNAPACEMVPTEEVVNIAFLTSRPGPVPRRGQWGAEEPAHPPHEPGRVPRLPKGREGESWTKQS
jgi:hypothetical protein